jgi:hypothetical protein
MTPYDMLWRWLKTACVAAVLLCAPMVAGHGFIMTPASRVSDLTSAYTPTGVSAGGPATVYKEGKLKYPNGWHGACGDDMTKPYPRMYEAGGQFYSINGGFSMTYYPQGGTATIQLYVSANHGGYWTFKICPVPDVMAGTSSLAENNIVNQQCFDAHQLQVKGTGGTGNAWFIDPGQSTPFVQKVTVVFPSALTCKRCVLQWHWLTANSCQPPGLPPKYGCNCGACGGGGADPEEFWNCADIGIVPRNQPKPADTTARAFSLNMKDMMAMNGVKPDGVKGQVSGPAVGTIDGSAQHVYYPETGGGGISTRDYLNPTLQTNTTSPEMPGMPATPSTPSTGTSPSSTSAPGGSFPLPIGSILVGLVGGMLVGLPLMGASMVYALVVGMITSAGTGVAFYFIRKHGQSVSQFLGLPHATRRRKRRKRRIQLTASIEDAMSLPTPPRTQAFTSPLPPQASTAFLEAAREYARYM